MVVTGSSGENLAKNESGSWQPANNQACPHPWRGADNSCQCSQTERHSRAPLVRSQEQPQVLLLQDSSMVLFFALCTWRQWICWLSVSVHEESWRVRCDSVKCFPFFSGCACIGYLFDLGKGRVLWGWSKIPACVYTLCLLRKISTFSVFTFGCLLMGSFCSIRLENSCIKSQLNLQYLALVCTCSTVLL